MYQCVGCGMVGQFDPPREAMPRIVLNYWNEPLCSECKRTLEQHLLNAHGEWIRNRRELIQLNTARSR